jgi:hypothetical protein
MVITGNSAIVRASVQSEPCQSISIFRGPPKMVGNQPFALLRNSLYYLTS